MARIFPDIAQIKQWKTPPEPGELHLLEVLEENLDDTYEVFFRVFLNGDEPDIVILRQNSGVLIIEVKDWSLSSYFIDASGYWRLQKNPDVIIRSPFQQVKGYKDNLYELHLVELLELRVKKPVTYGLINCAVYFHNATEEQASSFCDRDQTHGRDYIYLLGRDTFSTQERVNQLLHDAWMTRKSKYFTDDLYHKIRRHLQPPTHLLEDGKNLTYTKAQTRLIASKPGQQKIRGVVGSGKTRVMAKRAVNAHIRTGNRVLILTFNITLRNYIHDRISEVREQFKWDYFHITHYHLFFKQQANNNELAFTDFLADCDNFAFFDGVKGKIKKYDVILECVKYLV